MLNDKPTNFTVEFFEWHTLEVLLQLNHGYHFSPALFYQSTLLARPLVVPHKCQEQPYMLTARIHASQALYGQY